LIIPAGEKVAGWERALYAFLAEKERRSGARHRVWAERLADF